MSPGLTLRSPAVGLGLRLVRMLLLGLASAVHAAEPPTQTLLLVNAVYAPFVNPPGHPTGEGIDIEIAREALRRGSAGRYALKVELVPWKRALRMLEMGEADLTTTISRTGQRDLFLAWSVGYRHWVSYRLFTRRERGLNLRELEGLKGLSVGLSDGFYYPGVILDAPASRFDKAKDIAGALQMLVAGRVDLVVLNAVAARWEIREKGLGQEIEIQPYEYRSESKTFMAFSRKRPFEAPLKAMSEGLESMARDGSLARIERRYLD